MHNVFDNEELANIAERADYEAFIALHNTNPDYVAATVAWAVPVQRLDGKWVYPVCPDGYQEHTQEEFSPEWFPHEEDIDEV